MGGQDISSLVSVFEDFFTTIYKEKINDVLASYPTIRSIGVDFGDLDKFDTIVADRLLNEPEIVIEAAEEAVRNMNLTLPPGAGDFAPHVRFYNGPGSEIMIENLSSKKLNELVTFKGIITKRTDVMHKVKVAHYVCQACNETYNVQVTRNFKPPRMCASCKKLALVPNEEKSRFVDIQKAEAQDLLEKVSGGSPAAKMEIWFEDDMVNRVTPGENIQVTGILRIKPTQNLRQKNELVFNRYVEIVNVESLKRDFEEITLTKEDIQRVKELARQEGITERIYASIAPAIYGYTEVKKALALQLFGGTKGKMMKGDALVRDDIHLLLIGDPGIAKTRFLNSASNLAPKSMYVSGKSVSGVGLTASAEKDELGDGGWTLKAGALVLASGGIGAIDEFDKIDEEDRASLHEVMESQSYHYSTRLMLSDGREVPIGELVENYLEKNKKHVIRGRECIILKEGIEDISILTTDFSKITKTSPAQISKHTAPGHFVKVTLQNGREFMVTPEHPFWVMDGGNITTKEAEKLTTNDYTLMPRTLPIESKIPDVGKEFFKFIGYHLTDGGYELNRGRKNGINFHNKDPLLIEDYHDAASSLFGVPIHSSARPSTGVMAERIISMPVLRRLESIYPPLTGSGKEKHIPPILLSAPLDYVSQMLKSAFDGDGTFTNGHIILVGENKEFALQSQLLLLRFGVRSRIYRDGNVWRLSIGGRENLEKYAEKIGFLSEKKRERLTAYLQRGGRYRNTTDVVPNCAGKVFSLLKHLKIHENKITGYGFDAQKKGYSFTIKNFRKICSEMRIKATLLQEGLAKSEGHTLEQLIRLRKQLNISQQDMERFGGVKRATISYWETRKLSREKYLKALNASMEKMLSAEADLLKLEGIAFGDVGFVSIKKIEKIPNKSEKWVYDVTVHPTQAFISECAVLHNTVSIAKAGIVAKFKAKTAIIAAANPKHGRFNQTKNLADQFDVPPSLLSRFDLIFPIIDVLDEEKDLSLAEHILTSHIEAAKGIYSEDETELLEKEVLRKYIAYARRHIHPILSDSAKNKIKDFYLDLRRRGKSSGSVPITPRYLEGLVRLSEAHAKMRLSDTVELADAEIAVGLLGYVLKKVMTDQETGRLDVDIITTGRARSQVEKWETLLDIIKEKTREQEAVPRQDVLDEAEAAGIEPGLAKRILSELMRKGEVYEKEPGWIALVGNR